MKAYTEQEFITLLNSRSDLNFLAAAITPWHALGIDAMIQQLTGQGISLCGYIMIVAHEVSGTGITEDNFCMRDTEGIEVVCITDHISSVGLYHKLKRRMQTLTYYMGSGHPSKIQDRLPLYWVVPLKPSYELIPQIAGGHREHRLSIILIDEGIAGTYLTTRYRWWQLATKEGGMKNRCRAFWSLFIQEPYFLARLKHRGCITYQQLLMKSAGHWVPNQPVITAYRDILRRTHLDKDYTYYSRAVILNSDMLKETGILDSDIDLDLYHIICDTMVDSHIPVILKPHPREKEIARYESLSCQIERTAGLAQESIWGTLQDMPYCVIGFASTTLITAQLLFGIQAISLNYLVQDDFVGDKRVFEKFNQTFADMICFPKDTEELVAILHDIKKK